MPGLPIKNPLGKIRLPGAFGQVADAVGNIGDALKDKPEYLVQHAKGKEAPKVYGGFEKDGQITWKEMTREDLAKLNQSAERIPVKTLPQMKTELASVNTPTSIASALDVASRVDKRLQASGLAHDTGLDQDIADLAKKGQKPADVANTVDQTRTDLIRELNQDLAEIKGLKKKQHPELEQIAEGSNPPMTIRETMQKSIEGALKQLQPAENLSNAVGSFETQVLNAASPATPKPAPAATLGNF